MSFQIRKAEHTPFEAEVVRELRDQGFAVTSPAYHDYMPQNVCDLMRRLNTPTTELARNGADLFAIHTSLSLAMYAEVKTHSSKRYHDLTAEACQFVQRVDEADNGVLCLFCYRDPGVREVGFWMHQCPRVREVQIPERWRDEVAERWYERFARALPGVTVRRARNTNGGSDTPFIIINECELRNLPDWRDQIDDLVRQTAVCYGGPQERDVGAARASPSEQAIASAREAEEAEILATLDAY